MKYIWDTLRSIKEDSDNAYASESPDDKIITEPDENKSDDITPEDSVETEELPDIYELYPNLSEVDITCPCAIAEFFMNVCDQLKDEKEDSDEDNGESDLEPDEGEVKVIKISLGTPDEFGGY